MTRKFHKNHTEQHFSFRTVLVLNSHASSLSVNKHRKRFFFGGSSQRLDPSVVWSAFHFMSTSTHPMRPKKSRIGHKRSMWEDEVDTTLNTRRIPNGQHRTEKNFFSFLALGDNETHPPLSHSFQRQTHSPSAIYSYGGRKFLGEGDTGCKAGKRWGWQR